MLQKEEKREWGLLCKYCELAIQGGKISHSRTESINWNNLFEIAKKNKVRPLLYKGINEAKHEQYIPTDLLTSLKKAVFDISIFNLRQTKELLQLQKLFKESALKVVPYKGSILALEAYGALNLREISDIDLLVNEPDFPTIQQLLLDRNYQTEMDVSYEFFKKYNTQYYEYNFDYYKNGQRVFHVEPHWLIGPKRHQIPFGLSDFKELLISKKFLNTDFTTFTPEGLLLSTVLHHGGQDSWSSLKQVADLVAIMNKFSSKIDWKSFFILLNDWKVTNLFLLGIGMAKNLFDITLPHFIEQQLKSSNINTSVKNKLIKLASFNKKYKPTNSIFQQIWFQVTIRKYWSTKLKVIYYHLIQMIRPNVLDVKGKEGKEINMFWLTLKKPFRLIQQLIKEQ